MEHARGVEEIVLGVDVNEYEWSILLHGGRLTGRVAVGLDL
ncbi:MAG: hypothetical protein AB7I30_06345 [Isosphaeraceae bacterium]